MQQSAKDLFDTTTPAMPDWSSILADLQDATDLEIATAIDHALERIGKTLRLDGVSLSRLKDVGEPQTTHAWTADRAPAAAFDFVEGQPGHGGWTTLVGSVGMGVLLTGRASLAAIAAAKVQSLDLTPVLVMISSMLRRADRAAMLDRSADRYRAMLESLPDIVTEVDVEGRYTHAQARDPRQLIAAPEAMLGRILEDVLPADVALQRREMMRELDAGLRPESRLFFLGKNGETRWFHVSAARVGEGLLSGYLFCSRDVTRDIEQQHAVERMSADLLARTGEADAARRQLVDAIESLEDGFVIYDTQDRLALCNGRLREFYATAAPMLTPGRPFAEIIRYAVANGQFSDAHGSIDEWIASRANRTHGMGISFERALPDGRILRVVERLTPNGDRIGIHSDITDLKNAEKRLLDVIEGSQACTWEWNVVTGEQFVNKRWAEMLGYSLSELSPVNYDVWRGFVHPDDIAKTERMIEDCFSGVTDIYRTEYRQRHKEGHWVWLLDRGRITARNDRGEPTYMVGVQFEIGEQKAREAALTEAKLALECALADRASAERRFFDIAAVSDGWFWEQDADLRFSFLSQAPFFDALGMPQETIIGKTREDWLASHPDVRASADWAGLLSTMHDHAPFHDFIYRAPSVADRDERWFRISGAPVFDAAGVFTGYRGVGAEVTELVLAKARAEEASRTKSMFLANMSHEIRTPLNGVLGMAEVLDASLTDPNHKRMIGTIRRSGGSLLNILNDILDMSKIEAGKMELESVPFRLGDLAERVEELHSLRAEEKGIAFEVMIGSGSDLPRLGDPHRVQQILHNLVGNAIKFTEKGDIAVSIDGRNGKPLLIEVRDSGIGMSEAQVAKLHDEFSQADSSVTRRFGGTGLGMAITRTLVDMMEGTIDVSSVEGKGTTIRVTLPLPISESQMARATEPVSGPLDLTGVRVLAADDNATNRAVLDMMLKRCGAEAALFADGTEVLKAWKPGLFDIVLLDIAMPVMDGPTALLKIRALEERMGVAPMPVIAVTANVMSHQVAEYIALGFDSCVAKPLNSVDLSIAIRSLIATQ